MKCHLGAVRAGSSKGAEPKEPDFPSLHYITLHYITLHYITLHYIIVIEQTLLSRATHIEVHKQNQGQVR